MDRDPIWWGPIADRVILVGDAFRRVLYMLPRIPWRLAILLAAIGYLIYGPFNLDHRQLHHQVQTR